MKSINKLSCGILLFFALVSWGLKAQISGGITTGVSTGAVKMRDIGSSAGEVIKGNNIMGFEAGFFMKFKVGPVYLKPMAVFNYQKGEVTYQDQTITYKLNEIGVPLMFGLKIIGPLSIEAGPVYNYMLSVTRNYNDTRWDFNKNGLGWRAGAALNFGPVILSLSYEGMGYNIGGSGRNEFKEPYKIVFGAAIGIGG